MSSQIGEKSGEAGSTALNCNQPWKWNLTPVAGLQIQHEQVSRGIRGIIDY
jgi:hypothetical protein